MLVVSCRKQLDGALKWLLASVRVFFIKISRKGTSVLSCTETRWTDSLEL